MLRRPHSHSGAIDSLTTFRVRFERLLEGIVLVLVVALALVVVVGVGFRKFGAALVWYDEIASVLLAWLTYYGAALAALRRAHIGFPNLVMGREGRARVALVLVGEAVVIGFFLVAAWAGWRVLVILAGSSLVSLPAVPTRLTQSVIPIGAVLFIIAQLLSLPDYLRGPRYTPPSDGDASGGDDEGGRRAGGEGPRGDSGTGDGPGPAPEAPPDPSPPDPIDPTPVPAPS